MGLFTSPHLVDFSERIRVNGEAIEQQYVIDWVEKWAPRETSSADDTHSLMRFQPSFFELATMMAFCYFADREVDVAVIEVGLGGRLDSTNIIQPVLSIITNISFDHTQFLGDTLPQIAAEKAGIMKQGVPCVIGECEDERVRFTFEQNAQLRQVSVLDFACDRPQIPWVRHHTFYNIYETADGYIIGTLQGYNLLQSSIAANQAAESMPTIYLREVSMVNHDGKAVYGESLGSACLSTLHAQPSTEDCPTVFVLPYDEYALRFSCSIDRTPAGNTMYAYRLLPRDKEFTPLTPRAYYECSSLEQGRYTLQVKCLSAAENALPAEVTRSWQFVVLPPWYMTWWAYCLFAVLTLLWLSGVAYVLYVIADRSKRKALHEQQLRILQLENDRTQTRLQAKSQELTRIMHEEAIKQEDLAFAHEQLDKCLHDLQTHNLKKVEERLNNLKQHITSKAGDESIDWQRFEENFDEVNAGFCKQLTERYPWMNKQERKLCIYIHMGLLTKEIAPMLGLSTRGVEMLRYRMRCKMDLDPQANLKDYLTKITSNA